MDTPGKLTDLAKQGAQSLLITLAGAEHYCPLQMSLAAFRFPPQDN